MIIDPMIFTAVGDVFLNLSAGWFGAAFIFTNARSRNTRGNVSYIILNIFLGIVALVFGYKIRILGI